MSYQGTASPEAKNAHGGTMLLTDTVEQCHNAVSQILSTLAELDNRLFSPRPSPVAGKLEGSGPNSLEGAVNGLLSRLHEVENISSRLLHG